MKYVNVFFSRTDWVRYSEFSAQSAAKFASTTPEVLRGDGVLWGGQIGGFSFVGYCAGILWMELIAMHGLGGFAFASVGVFEASKRR